MITSARNIQWDDRQTSINKSNIANKYPCNAKMLLFLNILSFMKTITPNQLKELKNTVTLVDVRTPEEYQLEHIEWAINMPLDDFEKIKENLRIYTNIVCYCNTWNSSAQFCKRAEHAWFDNVLNLSWWLSWCKTCTTIKKKWALPMMQQVQIAAWSLVLLWILLAKTFHNYTWHEYFIWLSAFVWAWLIFAWSTWWCGLAKLLVKLPRNRIPEINTQTEITGNKLLIKQFEDKNLAHYSYVAISNWEAIVVDPERDPTKYYTYIKEHNATIVWVLNTHPHADFASGHLEIHQTTGAKIYVWEKVWAEYLHIPLKWNETISFWDAQIGTYFTPGHSPDSISYLVKDAWGKEIWLFSWDRVFIGDVWRADLRESVGNIKAKQEELAALMYESTRSILPTLDSNLMLLPAHGAWTSCGKWLSKHNMDTLGNQIQLNPMLQPMTKEEFINELTADQPTIPAYFTNSVLVNKTWNRTTAEALQNIQLINTLPENKDILVIDTRSREQATTYPISNKSIVISHENTNFIGMIGAIIQPTQQFVLIIEKKADIQKVEHNILSIWYETQLAGIYCIEEHGYHQFVTHKQNIEDTSEMTILDVRSTSTYKDNPVYKDACNIPLEELPARIHELDKNSTYVPYCWWAYKSNIAISLLLAHWFTAKKMYV